MNNVMSDSTRSRLLRVHVGVGLLCVGAMACFLVVAACTDEPSTDLQPTARAVVGGTSDSEAGTERRVRTVVTGSDAMSTPTATTFEVLKAEVQRRRDEDVQARVISRPEVQRAVPCNAVYRALPRLREFSSEDMVEWSPDGRAVFFNDDSDVVGVSADGSRLWPVATAAPPDRRVHGRVGLRAPFSLAPDGASVAYAGCVLSSDAESDDDDRRLDTTAYQYELFRVASDAGSAAQLTETGVSSFDSFPAWSPDGTRIAFLSSRAWEGRGAAKVGVYSVAADGTDVRRVLVRSVVHQTPRWSPDGRHLAVIRYAGAGPDYTQDLELHVVGWDGAEPRRLATQVVSGASWSPDGKRLAFAQADESVVGLYTIAIDGSDAQRITTIDGPNLARQSDELAHEWIGTVAWSPDGSRILVVANDRSVGFIVGTDGRRLAEVAIRRFGLSGVRVAAWSPDGSRIALVGPARHGSVRQVWVATMARDGTDIRVLAERWGSDGYARALNRSAAATATDDATCTSGVAVPDPDANPRLAEDCAALLEIRRSVQGMGRLNWSADRPIGEWDGVTLGGTPPRVRELALPGRGMRGPWPAALGRLTDLRVLDLSGNRLTGELAETLSELQQLERLALGFNNLRGPIPPTLRRLGRLVVLDLSDNFFYGPVPPELGKLVSLRRLNLSANQLTGGIPSEIDALADLEVLDLHGNFLTGPIPVWLNQLTSLFDLNLAHNRLTGPIPLDLAQVARLRSLNLGFNDLTGDIPPELGQLPELQELWLGGNQWTGCVNPSLPLLDRGEISLADCEVGP